MALAYADRDGLVKRFGEQEIASLEDADNTGTSDVSVSANALQDGTEEANSYVAARYTLPLPSVPEPLTRAVCDIARFRLYKDRPTEQVTYRYERTIKWLEQLAAGKVLLTFDPVLTDVQKDDILHPATPAVGFAPGAVFGDSLLARMPGFSGSLQ
jgi:phage gp36-like protein